LLRESAALRAEIESLRERWACVECGRTPDGGKSGDLYISICHGCHRCVEHAEPTCTVCAYDTEGMRLRNRDLLVENAALRAQVEELTERNAGLIRGAQRMRCPEHATDASNGWGCPVCVSDLRAQVEELKRERDRQRGAAEKHYALAEERLVLLNHAEERAERAEARLAKVVEALADVGGRL
jgi:hypothetical protein